MKKVLIVLAIVVVVGGAAGYLFLGNGAKVETQTTGQIIRVEKIVRGDLNLTVSANGIVQPINKVEIKSKASGQVIELNFVEGMEITKGTLLIALDERTSKNDHEQAKADLELSEASAKQSENNLRRAQELFSKKLNSEQERDQANVDYVRSQTSLLKSRAALANVEEKLADTRITAPISGVILSKSVEIGQIIASGVSNVGGGSLIATIADMNEVYVETNVDEVDIGRVIVGQSARIVADSYPDDIFTGQIERIAPLGKTSQNVTTFSVIIRVKNIGSKLKAGMSTSVDIEIFRRQSIVLVPNEALKDPRSEQGRALLASIQKNAPGEENKPKTEQRMEQKQEQKQAQPQDQSAKKDEAKSPAVKKVEELRAKMQSASQEDRQQLRQQFMEAMQKLTPEEQEKMRSSFGGGRMGGNRSGANRGGSSGFTMGVNRNGGSTLATGGEEGARVKRQSQIVKDDEVKQRIVMIKDGENYVPRLIKVGPSNFEMSEVLDGLKEGDEIQIISISRAKLAQEQMNERMRSMSGMGGLSGSSARVPTGGGGGGGRH
ncbi:MAG: efflux RND transporter periplasmic adaptor subunit [bacterium]